MTRAGGRQQPQGQRAQARADLEDDVVGPQVGGAHDPPDRVRVVQEVLAERLGRAQVELLGQLADRGGTQQPVGLLGGRCSASVRSEVLAAVRPLAGAGACCRAAARGRSARRARPARAGRCRPRPARWRRRTGRAPWYLPVQLTALGRPPDSHCASAAQFRPSARGAVGRARLGADGDLLGDRLAGDARCSASRGRSRRRRRR